MKINIVAVGKLKEKYWVDAINEYSKRLSRFAEITVCEIPEGRSLIEEGKNILKKAVGYIIVTDIEGKALSSTEIADVISNNLIKGVSEFSIIIGSSEGLSDEVKNAADIKISFGKITYPHQLMRVIVFEQVYRAFTIINKLTYHK